MILRAALPEDAAALCRLATDAFVAAFGHLYRREDLDAFLAENRTVEVYRRHLASPNTHVMLAEAEGTLAGYCLLKRPSEFASESDASRPIALQQLYTAPAMTGRGIGAALMDWALGEARALGCDAVQLSVWSENFAAQRFYARYGFARIAEIGFMVGSHRDEEFLLELRL
ncbi:MAG: GNAT family N-acetyltransferase [Porphyrobacter sp.]|nr:GNAT family N-acetyltransferase [Porphyrobacter sp.]